MTGLDRRGRSVKSSLLRDLALIGRSAGLLNGSPALSFERMDGVLSDRSLVVGGTGMLSKATHWLAARSVATILVARHARRFASRDDRFVPFDLDWNRPTFADELCSSVAALGPIGRALLWLHDPEPTLRRLVPHLSGALVVVVLGSLDGQPYVPQTAAHLVTVRLGSKSTTGGGRRWLTDEEVSEGAIEALNDGRSRIVGELSPL